MFKDTKRSWQPALPWLLFLISLALNLSLISKGPYHLDCLLLAMQAKATLATGTLQPYISFGYPLTVILGACFIGLLELFSNTNSVLAVNLMSATMGALCVPAAYGLLKRILDDKAAFFGSALLGVFPLHLSLSTFGMSHTPTLFFLLAGLFFLADYKTLGKIRSLLFSGILLGLMGATRIQDLVLMSLPITFFYFLPLNKSTPIATTAGLKTKCLWLFSFWFGIGIVALLFHLPIAKTQSPDIFTGIWIDLKQTSLKSYASLDSLFFVVKISLRNLVQEFSPLGLLMALGGSILFWKNNPRIFYFFLLWFLCPFLFYGSIHTMAVRYLLLPFLPLVFSLGYFLAVGFLYPKRAFGLVLGFCAIIVINTFAIRILPVLTFRHQNAVTPDFARWVGRMTEPNAIIIADDDCPFINFYGKRQTRYTPVDIYSTAQDFSEFRSWLDAQLAHQVPIYVRLSKVYLKKSQNDFKDFLNDNYELRVVGQGLYEDWHHSTTGLHLLITELYQIKPRIP